MVVSLYSPDGRYDATFLANYATININDALAAHPGRRRGRIFGASDYAMRIWVKPDTLARLGLTVTDIVRTRSGRRTRSTPPGQIGGEPAPPGQQFTYTVRAQGRLMTPEEFGDVIVRANPDGSLVRVQGRRPHRARRAELPADAARFNGKPAARHRRLPAPRAPTRSTSRDGGRRHDGRAAKQLPARTSTYEVSLDTTLPVNEGIAGDRR